MFFLVPSAVECDLSCGRRSSLGALTLYGSKGVRAVHVGLLQQPSSYVFCACEDDEMLATCGLMTGLLPR